MLNNQKTNKLVSITKWSWVSVQEVGSITTEDKIMLNNEIIRFCLLIVLFIHVNI